MCRIASLFLLQVLKGSMSGQARDFNNIETRAVIKFFCPWQGKRIRVDEGIVEEGNFSIFKSLTFALSCLLTYD